MEKELGNFLGQFFMKETVVYQMRSKNSRKAFTLIEILVVVAILALLIAILLPSLARARAQSQMVACQANVKSLCQAFIMYTRDNDGRLPGCHDTEADFMGVHYGPNGERIYGPEGGTIYRNYMGSQSDAYLCPTDKKEEKTSASSTGEIIHTFSYTMYKLMAGAKTEWVQYTHYRESPAASDPNNYSKTDHTADMVRIDGVPMIIEEDWYHNFGRTQFRESDWCLNDCLTDRHLKVNGKGRGSMGFVDGHVDSLMLRPLPKEVVDWGEAMPRGFVSGSMCVRSSSGKWVDDSDSRVDQEPYGCFLEVSSNAEHK
jgi:prepilin-type N-terminal cleavage/methylation domain-containing protein/prepilin-type processing-associated H-X9-DG protein